jgi:signal transduction histidine kinase
MRERAELLGGTCTIASAPGTGTTVTITLPIDRTSTA